MQRTDNTLHYMVIFLSVVTEVLVKGEVLKGSLVLFLLGFEMNSNEEVYFINLNDGDKKKKKQLLKIKVRCKFATFL